jgi:hypothetical protein
VRYEIRPLGLWTGPVTRNRPGCRFRAAWADTLELLGRETEKLGARLVVIQVDADEGDVRRDGMLRATARVGFPGVRVSFESRHGPLTYATDRYDRWRDNVRAVALSLEALRAVDRYGVSGSGEQYRGWQQIEAEPHTRMTAEQAAEFVAAHAGNGYVPAEVMALAEVRARAFRAAAGKLHPDRGGDPEQFRRLTAARALLDRARAT